MQPAVREFTVRAVILGILLAIILGAANAYLGLYAGMTVSASIPAAVISMALLRGLFRSGTIQENNIVQSIASAGESLAAGVIFTVPALVLIGVWNDFQFWPTTLIALVGGGLGVIFLVPLRKVMITEQPSLTFPEGQACAEVLRAGDRGGQSLTAISLGAALGLAFKLLTEWFGLLARKVESALSVNRHVFYGGIDVSPALLGVGYVVGLEIALLLVGGGALGSLVFLPLSGLLPNHMAADEFAAAAWSAQIRFLGVGGMLVGGLYSLVQVRRGIGASLKELFRAGAGQVAPRDIPRRHLAFFFLLGLLGTLVLYDMLLDSLWLALLIGLIMMLLAALFVAVAAYIVGLVGSSNSPVSGMTICALLLASGVILGAGLRGESASLAILGVAGLVCCATCTAGDIAQDLKTGELVGATPSKQQYGELIGVAASAPIFAGTLSLLHQAYTIGGEDLRAPQAALFASLTGALTGEQEIPLNTVGLGAAVALLLVLVDRWLDLRGSRYRAHPMPVAVGLYLPFALTVTIFAGGVMRALTDRSGQKNGGSGVLFASGLIAGDALAGVAGAIFITRGFEGLPALLPPLSLSALSMGGMGLLCLLFYRLGLQTKKKP